MRSIFFFILIHKVPTQSPYPSLQREKYRNWESKKKIFPPFPIQVYNICAEPATFSRLCKLLSFSYLVPSWSSLHIGLQQPLSLFIMYMLLWLEKVVVRSFISLCTYYVGYVEKYNSKIAVWKFQHFSVTQILREINFWGPRSSKNATFCNFRILNFVHLVFQPSKSVQIHKNQNSARLNMLKCQWNWFNVKMYDRKKTLNFHTVSKSLAQFLSR